MVNYEAFPGNKKAAPVTEEQPDSQLPVGRTRSKPSLRRMAMAIMVEAAALRGVYALTPYGEIGERLVGAHNAEKGHELPPVDCAESSTPSPDRLYSDLEIIEGVQKIKFFLNPEETLRGIEAIEESADATDAFNVAKDTFAAKGIELSAEIPEEFPYTGKAYGPLIPTQEGLVSLVKGFASVPEGIIQASGLKTVYATHHTYEKGTTSNGLNGFAVYEDGTAGFNLEAMIDEQTGHRTVWHEIAHLYEQSNCASDATRDRIISTINANAHLKYIGRKPDASELYQKEEYNDRMLVERSYGATNQEEDKATGVEGLSAGNIINPGSSLRRGIVDDKQQVLIRRLEIAESNIRALFELFARFGSDMHPLTIASDYHELPPAECTTGLSEFGGSVTVTSAPPCRPSISYTTSTTLPRSAWPQ